MAWNVNFCCKSAICLNSFDQDCRYNVWQKMTEVGKLTSTPKLCALPPTSEVFKLNVMRAHFQAAVWKSSLLADPPSLDPCQVCYLLSFCKILLHNFMHMRTFWYWQHLALIYVTRPLWHMVCMVYMINVYNIVHMLYLCTIYFYQQQVKFNDKFCVLPVKIT